MHLSGGGSLLLRFISPVGRSEAEARALTMEAATHHDWIELPARYQRAGSGPATCAVRLLAAFQQLVADEPSLDFVLVTDDDVWLSPPRLQMDLRELIELSHQRHVLYGQIAFTAGWSGRMHHYGFAPFPDIEDRLPRFLRDNAWRRRRERAPGALGPFPFAMGYGAILSRGLALDISRSEAVLPFLAALLATAASRTPPRGLPPGKCFPGTDVALGWALATAKLSLPLVVLDVTYAARMLPFAGPSAATELTRRAAILHNATRWEDFRSALCLSTLTVPGDQHAGGTANTSRPRHEVAPVMRCRGPGAPLLQCGAMHCGGPTTRLHEGSACQRDRGCTTYYNQVFSNVTFCIATRSRRVARAVLRVPSVCELSQADVLHSCMHSHILSERSQSL